MRRAIPGATGNCELTEIRNSFFLLLRTLFLFRWTKVNYENQRCRRNDFCVLRHPQPTRNQQAAERGPRARNADGTLLSADNADDCGTRIVIQPTSRKCSKTRYVLLFKILKIVIHHRLHMYLITYLI